MKSIRLSLIVYFLSLIALALGGVSVLAYQTASKTLQAKQASTEDLIRTQFDAQCSQARAVLDRRLSRQAQLLANRARFVPIRNQIYLSTAAGIGSGNFSRVLAPVWIAPLAVQPGPLQLGDYWPSLSYWFDFRLAPVVRLAELQIPAAAVDAIMPSPMDDDHPLEVFQVYRRSGVPVQRSASLKDYWFTLSAAMRESTDDWREDFDEIELDGRSLRRVTVKTKVDFFFGGSRKLGGKGAATPKTKAPSTSKAPLAPMPMSSPFFIQYASETTHVDDQIREFEATRDARLVRSAEETQSSLLQVRRRLWWISVLT